ncbi:unnamed protein product [Paramecium pentaurelia]|uniref:Uncharacterized protein n=1 Tax=Paramecium pentaurelia TaxID=43138 RepID=A0A8S1X957_9CILI|nr:unnamed protein product [Paramecium pentaurelia]
MQPFQHSRDDYLNKQVNKLLTKASNIHMKTCEVKVPTRRNSMIESYILTNDIQQQSDGIRKQKIDKNRSCSNLQDYQEESNSTFKQLQFSQLSIMNKNTKLIMLRVENKLKNFRFAKENDNTISTSTIAKMQSFCLDNQCFDFYSCTDLLLLKYLIYLLLQEINSLNQNYSDQQLLLSQKCVNKDTIETLQYNVDDLKNKKHRNSIENLDKQINKMQRLIGEQLSLPNYDMFTTPQSNIKKSEFVFQPSSNTQKIKCDQSQSSFNTQKMIQFQIDELKMKNQTITKLTSRINNLEEELKFVNNQISDTNLNLQISQNSLTVKDQELKDLIKKNEKLVETTNQTIQEKDRLQDQYKSVKNDYELLQTKYNELQKTNQSILKESQIQKKSLNHTVESSQQQMKKEEQKLQKELLDKNKLIRLLSEDGKILGQYLKDISYKIQQIPTDQIPQNLQMLQRELYLNECLVNTKLNNMHLAQIDLVKFNNVNNEDKKSRKFMNCHNQLIDQMKSFQIHSDLMAMMVIQSEIIEKFMY